MKKYIIVLLLASLVSVSKAQKIVPCLTDELYLEALKKNPALKLEEDRGNAIIAQMTNNPNLQKKGPVRIVPVVFHVIHKNGMENISITQLNDALRVLNEDFRKKAGTNGGSSTDPLATDMEVEFRLAQLDPNGQLTNGVNRIYNLGTDDARDTQKSLSYWDAKKYFNIWVVNAIRNSSGNPLSMVLGYAQFPTQINSNTNTDGVMCRSDQMGLIETSNISQAGRTLTHEAGHWLALYHPFQGGCTGGTSGSCLNFGDQVCDTPPVSTATTGCPSNRNSCTNDSPDKPDLVKNFMDYADGNCMNMYTNGQKTRVNNAFPLWRSQIISTANLSAAGLNADGTYKPIPVATIKVPYSFGFNVASLAGTGWTTENYMSPGDSGWQVNNTLGAVGSGTMASMNLKNWRTNIRNAFVSPSLDLTTIANPNLSFYIAYAKRSTASGDRVRVYISNSFGRSEILVRTLLAGEMETGLTQTTSFVPGATEWKKFNIDLTPYNGYTNCKIRFELQSLRGNNIYFDEFSIGQATGVSELLKRELDFTLFPNPSKEITTITFNNPENINLEINLLDLQGKVLKSLANETFTAGKHELNFDVKDMNTGVYIVEVKSSAGRFVHKILVE